MKKEKLQAIGEWVGPGFYTDYKGRIIKVLRRKVRNKLQICMYADFLFDALYIAQDLLLNLGLTTTILLVPEPIRTGYCSYEYSTRFSLVIKEWYPNCIKSSFSPTQNTQNLPKDLWALLSTGKWSIQKVGDGFLVKEVKNE